METPHFGEGRMSYTAYNNLYKYCKRLDLKVSDTFRKRAIECLHKMSDEQINELYKQYKEK